MSTAEEIRAASTNLRTFAAHATLGMWSVGNGEVIGLDIKQTGRGSFTYGAQLARVIDDEDRDEENAGGHNLGSAEDDARWIALASPLLAEPWAAVLDEAAQRFDDEVKMVDAEGHGKGCPCGGAYISDLKHDACGHWLFPRCDASGQGCTCFVTATDVARGINAIAAKLNLNAQARP